MKEKSIETRLVREVKKLGGICVKNANTGLNGFPDRTCYFPNAVCMPVELKAPGKKPDPLQKLWLSKLRGLGFYPYIISNKTELQSFLLIAKSLIDAKL